MAEANKLNERQKAYVVRRLAAYDRPSVIARELARDFGVTITPQMVGQYNPERAGALAPRWRDLFAQARAAHLAEHRRHRRHPQAGAHPPARARWRTTPGARAGQASRTTSSTPSRRTSAMLSTEGRAMNICRMRGAPRAGDHQPSRSQLSHDLHAKQGTRSRAARPRCCMAAPRAAARAS